MIASELVVLFDVSPTKRGLSPRGEGWQSTLPGARTEIAVVRDDAHCVVHAFCPSFVSVFELEIPESRRVMRLLEVRCGEVVVWCVVLVGPV